MKKWSLGLAVLVLTSCQPLAKEEPVPPEQVDPASYVPPAQISEGVRQRMQEHGYWAVEQEAPAESRSTADPVAPLRDPPADRWARIEAGSFQMGSPPDEEGRFEIERQHRVTLTRSFLMQTTEVTQRQWLEVLGSAHSRNACAQCPVERVSWKEAIAFLNKLSVDEGLPPCFNTAGAVIGGESIYACRGYRLPTEAEWEYAARAGSTESRYGELRNVAWYYENSGDRAHPVGQKEPNAWGLFDMYGNVWEWTSDWYADYPGPPRTDPVGPVTGERRVSRGGSWDYCSKSMRAAFRHIGKQTDRFCVIGFRPVRTLP